MVTLPRIKIPRRISFLTMLFLLSEILIIIGVIAALQSKQEFIYAGLCATIVGLVLNIYLSIAKNYFSKPKTVTV